MKRLALLTLLAFAPLSASFCSGAFEVEAAALYLRPSACEYPFAISDKRPFTDTATNNAHLPDGKHREVDPKYEWGFRVGLAYVFDCYDLKVGYSRVHTEDTHKTGESFWPTFAHPRYMGFVNGTGGGADLLFAQSPFFSDSALSSDVRSRVDFEYDAVDIEFALHTFKGCRLFLRPYMGLHLADILHRFRADYEGSLEPEQSITATGITSMRFKECSWGIGPLIGLDGRYEIGCGFGVSGHIGFALLVGERDGDICATDLREWMGADAPDDVDERLFVHMEEQALLFPNIRTSFGIHYHFCLCGLLGCIELAYELQTYINALHTLRFNDQRGTGMADCHSFDLNGLTLSIRLQL